MFITKCNTLNLFKISGMYSQIQSYLQKYDCNQMLTASKKYNYFNISIIFQEHNRVLSIFGWVLLKQKFIKSLNEKYYSIYTPLYTYNFIMYIFISHPNNIANNFEKSIIHVEIVPNSTFARWNESNVFNTSYQMGSILMKLYCYINHE